ncbi:MAG: flagellar hook-length control protein FliK [Alphaproteobacteria bacterium]|nr:flagellar hook-length control protein FliK [Alphaproteobacteria bacterium]
MTAAVTITPTERSGPPAAGPSQRSGTAAGSASFASLLNGQSLSELALLGLSQSVDLNARLPDQSFAPRRSAPTDRPAPGDIQTVEPDDRERDRNRAVRDEQPGAPTPGASEIAATLTQAVQERSQPPQTDTPRGTAEPAATKPVSSRDSEARPAVTPRAQAEPPQPRAAEQPPTPPKAQITDAPKPLVSQSTATLGARAAVVAQIAADKTAANPSMNGGLAAKANQGSLAAAGALAQHAHGASKNGNTTAAGQPHPATSANASTNTQVANAAAPPAMQAANGATGGRLPFVAAASAASQSGTMQTAPQFGDMVAQSGNALTNGTSVSRSTEAAAAPRPQPAIPARVVTNQVAVQIQKAVANGSDRINIQLKPAELGRVDIRLDVAQDGRVSAVVSVERQDTLELLQRDARTLQTTLQDAGLKAGSDSLNFELRQQATTARDEPDSAHNQSDGDSTAADDGPAGDIAHARVSGEGRVDIEI